MYQQTQLHASLQQACIADVDSMLGAAAVAISQQRYAHLLRHAEMTSAVGMYRLKSLVSGYTCVHEGSNALDEIKKCTL